MLSLSARVMWQWANVSWLWLFVGCASALCCVALRCTGAAVCLLRTVYRVVSFPHPYPLSIYVVVYRRGFLRRPPICWNERWGREVNRRGCICWWKQDGTINVRITRRSCGRNWCPDPKRSAPSMYEVSTPTSPHHRRQSQTAEVRNKSSQSVHSAKATTAPILSGVSHVKRTASLDARAVPAVSANSALPLASTVRNRVMKLLRRANSARGERREKGVCNSSGSSSGFGSTGGMVISNKRYVMKSEQPLSPPPACAVPCRTRIVSGNNSPLATLPSVSSTATASTVFANARPLVVESSVYQSNGVDTEENSPVERPTTTTFASISTRNMGRSSAISHKEKLIRFKEGERVLRLRRHSEARKLSRQLQQQQQQHEKQSQIQRQQKVKYVILEAMTVTENVLCEIILMRRKIRLLKIFRVPSGEVQKCLLGKVRVGPCGYNLKRQYQYLKCRTETLCLHERAMK